MTEQDSASPNHKHLLHHLRRVKDAHGAMHGNIRERVERAAAAHAAQSTQQEAPPEP